MVSAELSKKLRAAFPSLTVDRLQKIWEFVVFKMPRGEIMFPDPDMMDPSECIVALILCRELCYRDEENYRKIIQNLSAHSKRSAFPNSYGV